MDGIKKISSLSIFTAFFLIYSCQVKMPVAVQFFETTSDDNSLTDTVLNDEFYKNYQNQTDSIAYSKNPTKSHINDSLSTDTIVLSLITDSLNNNSFNKQHQNTTDTIFNTHYIKDTRIYINDTIYKSESKHATNQNFSDSELYLNILNSLDSIQNLLTQIASKESKQHIEEKTILVDNTNVPKNAKTRKTNEDLHVTNLLKTKSDSIVYLQQKIQLFENTNDTEKFNFILLNLKGSQDSIYKNLITQKSDSILVLQNRIHQYQTDLNYHYSKRYSEKDSLFHSTKQDTLINNSDSIQEITFKIKSDSIKLLQKQIVYYQKTIRDYDVNKIIEDVSNSISDTVKNINTGLNIKDSVIPNDSLIVSLKSDTIYINKPDTLSFIGFYKSNSLKPINIIEITKKISNINTNSVITILVAAYTDISGSPSINYELSNRRISEFENILLNDFHFDRRIIYKQAFGSIYATYPQNEKERKIEIKFIISKKR
ncbi:MAG: hypothetical protein PHE33_03135 [Bacteroidales bacterium]|nr:hypothetical protein [Bacteroidales bacterium]